METDGTSSVLLVDAEDRIPYKRTKVSKSFAAGFQRDAFCLAEEPRYRDDGLALLTGRRAIHLDPQAHTLMLDNGRRIGWEKIILATGTTPRRLDVARDVLERIHFPVTAAAAEALREEALRSQTALVIGMGVLGVEVADQLVRMGKKVTVAGNRSVLMPDELNTVASGRLERVLLDAGVELLYETQVNDIQVSDSGYDVSFSGPVPDRSFDLVVCGIGVEPNTALAARAGLEVDRGIRVNHQLQTSHPDVLAAGDVAQHPDGRVTHLWRHAEHQGRVAGRNAAGAGESYRFVPFRLKCSILDSYFFSVGRPAPESLSEYEVVEHTSGARYLCSYYRDSHLEGLIMLNDEDRRSDYLQAVVEKWPRKRFESTFS